MNYNANDEMDTQRCERMFAAMLTAVEKVTTGSDEELGIRPAETIDAAIGLIGLALAVSVKHVGNGEQLKALVDSIANNIESDVGYWLGQLEQKSGRPPIQN